MCKQKPTFQGISLEYLVTSLAVIRQCDLGLEQKQEEEEEKEEPGNESPIWPRLLATTRTDGATAQTSSS